MATKVQVLICNRNGVPLADISPDIESASWRLNSTGMCKFSLPWTDAKCTQDNLKFGNRLLIQFDNGLPNWGGVLDPPRTRQQGVIGCTAYTAERLLDWRVTDKGRYFSSQDAGYIAKKLLEYENADWATGISDGSITETGTDRTLEYHFHDLLQRYKDLARLSGQDFYVAAAYSGGVLSFTLNWYEARGTDYSDSVWLLDGANVSSAKLSEQGPLANVIRLAGEGTSWGDERLTSIDADADSRESYGYREYSEVQLGVVNATTLDDNAATLLSEMKDPRNVYDLTVTNDDPGDFASYDVGDTVHAELFVDSAEWYVANEVRVYAREWHPDDVCRLVVRDV